MALVDALCAASSDAVALIYDTFNATSAAGLLLDGGAAFRDAGIVEAEPVRTADALAGLGAAGAMAAPGENSAPARRKRRRRARSCKSWEESECQRMTHIAVERNRRRQMNEYLAALRSLMPESYVQRGDQASIVGGAIDFVKELEQQLQSLEAQKRTLGHQYKARFSCDGMPMMCSTSNAAAACVESTSNCSSSVTEDGSDAAPFAGFFTYPQYVWCHSPEASAESRAGVADIEVNLVETHANLRVMSPRMPGQLLRMVAGLQALRLAVLHLNVVTTLDSMVLYSISVKVEEGCGLTTADDIAAAVHHVLCCIISSETPLQQLT